MLLAIGSPALAGYSLAITRLNSRWLSRKFLDLHFANKINVPLAVSALQHIPFRIDVSTSLLPSLIVLPQNDRYWKLLGTAARRTRQWSIPVGMNIVWALVAFLFTIISSFADFSAFITLPGDAGYSIAAMWTYLLPVVVGWLYVGSQLEAGHLRDALKDAHERAFVATDLKPVLTTEHSNHPTPAIEAWTALIDYVNADEKKTVPIFNYSRVFIWSQHADHISRLYQHAAARAHHKIPVNGGVWETHDPDAILDQDRTGTENQVVEYCTEGLDANAKQGQDPAWQLPTLSYHYSALPLLLPTPSKYSKETPVTGLGVVPGKPVFAAGVFLRVAFAAILALALQWGTTGASILIHLNTPPKGLGCRALTFIVYGSAATVSFLLLLFSSILAHSARLRQSVHEKRPDSKKFIGYMAALSRWSGKTIAIMNGLAILISCTLQFGGIYDNCFCSSTIIGGALNGVVSFTAPDIRGSEVYASWIGGTVMAFGVSGLYCLAIYVAALTN